MSNYTFIPWDSIEVRGERSGVKKTTCPICSETRKKKKEPCLYVNFNRGMARCYNCDALSFVPEDTPTYEQTYTPPPQDWKNHTNLSDNLVKWVKDARSIHQTTLVELGVTEEKIYQPAASKELNSICFNYFEGKKLVNKKYRSGKKHFTQSAGGKSIFYNINSIIGEKECFIVEGEFDVLALHNVGIKNAISVPNGANDNDEYWKNSEKYLKDIETYIIAVDNDEKGIALREKIAQRLGRYNCRYIEWKHKDANGDLIEGCIRQSLESIKRFPVGGTFNSEDLLDGIYDLYNNGLPDTIYPKHECFGRLKEFYSGMRGHLCTITGIPSHGKSNFSEWYVLNLVNDYDMKASFFSPEHSPMTLHTTTFIQKAVGKNFWKDMDGIPRISRADIERYNEWAKEKIYLTGPEKGQTPTWEWLLEKFKEQMYSYGIDIFVIDAFNKLVLPKGPKLDAINEVLTKLTAFAQMNNVMVFLVVHPTKMRKSDETGLYAVPTLYDCSGSADFRNQTHDGASIYRYFESDTEQGRTRFINMKTKYGFQGTIGEFQDYSYQIPTGRYYTFGSSPPTFDMTQPEYEQAPLIPDGSFDDDHDPDAWLTPNNEEPDF